MLESVFRSLIDVKKSNGQRTVDVEDLVENFRSFQNSRLSNEEEAYKVLYHEILDHYRNFQELPDFNTLEEHFKEVDGNESVIIALDKIKSERPRIGSDFKRLLKTTKDEQNQDTLNEFLNKANDIAMRGIEIGTGKKKKRIKGVSDAVNWFIQQARGLQQSMLGVKLEGDTRSRQDVSETWEKYRKKKGEESETIGIFTGLNEIDSVCNGLKHGELMLVAAYVGQLKTTTCLNMFYRAIITGWDSGFVSLEMSFEEMRDMIIVLHTCNPMFLSTEYGHLVGTVDYNDFANGKLTEEQEEFFQFALEDWENNEDYGRCYLWQPDMTTVTVEDIEVKCLEWNAALSQDDRKLEFLCVDYIALMGVDQKHRSKDGNENLNNIIKNMKRMCLNFNQGQGMRMISPFQVNRKGYLEASSNGGLYNGTHLSNANEAERSADVVIASFMSDEMRDNRLVTYCCVKNRRNPFFKPFQASVNFTSRFIHDIPSVEESDDVEVILSEDLG
jgi:replicative DNA helicase